MSDLIHGKRQGTDIDRGGGKGEGQTQQPYQHKFHALPSIDVTPGGFDMNFTGGADVTIPTVAVDGSQRDRIVHRNAKGHAGLVQHPHFTGDIIPRRAAPERIGHVVPLAIAAGGEALLTVGAGGDAEGGGERHRVLLSAEEKRQ